MVGLSEAYLAELRERMHAVTHPQDDERAQNVIDALDQERHYPVAHYMARAYNVYADTVELTSNHAFSSTGLSNVYEGRCQEAKVAVKEPRLHVDDVKAVQKAFRNEIVTWKYLRHPNIVPFLGTSNLFPVCVASKWMPGGTISTFLREHPEENRSKYIEHIVRGLDFMHTLGVIHGDLKAANILIDEHRNARLADFGLVTILSTFSTQATTVAVDGVKGTTPFMAPELLAVPDPGSDGPRPSVSSDIYALAVTLWQLFTGRTPFSHIRFPVVVVMQVLNGVRPSKPAAAPEVGFTDGIWEVMERGWSAEPLERPKLPEFLKAVALDLQRHHELAVTEPGDIVISSTQRTTRSFSDTESLKAGRTTAPEQKKAGSANTASALGMSHEQVKKLIEMTATSELEHDRVLNMRDQNASVVVNGLQRWLDSTAVASRLTPWLALERQHAIRLLVELATHSEQVPDGHYLTGVTYDHYTPAWYGGFSDVHQATWSNRSVVVKRLRVNEGDSHGTWKRQLHRQICVEGLTWRQLDHPNIVKFLGVYREERDDRLGLSLVSTRAHNHLRGYLCSTDYHPHSDRQRLLIGIANALDYLHDQGIAHGDVSLNNILIDHGRPLLTDFGLIAVGDGSTGHLVVPQGGEVQYMAPEFLFASVDVDESESWFAGDVTSESQRTMPIKTRAGDVFAYGRLILAIAIKDNPFGSVSDHVALHKIKLGFPRNKPPASRCHGAPVSDLLWDLTMACFRTNPRSRPPMKEVLRRLSVGVDA